MSSSPHLPSAPKEAREATVHGEHSNATDAEEARCTSHTATNLLDLPHELLFRILDSLSYRGLNAICSTCKSLRQALQLQALQLSRFDRALFRSGDERCGESGDRAVEDATADYARREIPRAAWLALDGPYSLITPDAFPIDVHPGLRSLGWRMEKGREVLAT
ncbi:hypothetical protein CF327_g7271 [Tilletia walkeri]|uniref:F-box domain-containing protein n=1 Tax=Tilletia walkeri TaxID=117179 RepID=A0A8X7N409_9BASI|nr:hypothetical protein CF327_g7271 [Tilletia walkeri]KAE8264445.1 hypothetical protein A4X09_0g6963 [Tilletia walkeri]